jgi:NAD(P)-dependent dehydrogenase (short-subunit alcohol dehydrogenase family)
MERQRFTDKVVLVTGGAAGLGRADSLAFAREGAKVVICGRREQQGAETVDMIKDLGGEAVFIQCDISKSDEIKHLFEEIDGRYGRLDCACNNAAIPDSPQVVPTHEYPAQDWDDIYFTNVKGTWLCMKYEIEAMLKNGGGSIVNIASILAYRGSEGRSGYIAGSHGIVGLTKTAALEYAVNNIRINCICPGGISSDPSDPVAAEYIEKYAPMFPMKRLGEPSEMAMPVLFLCSADASFVTGVVLPVDGGWSAG